MREGLIRIALILSVQLVCYRSSIAQNSPDLTLKDFSTWFDNHIGGEQNRLYSGVIYIMRSASRTTHQFYQTNTWRSGDISFSDNRTYYDIPLVFDIEKELIVVKHPQFGRRDGIQLLMNDIVFFSVEDHFFRKEEVDGRKGFYEILLEGTHFDLLAKRRKELKVESARAVYKEYTEYLLQNPDTIVLCKNKKSLDILMKESKVVTNKIEKEYKVRFSRTKEVKLIDYLRRFDEEMGK